MSEIEYPFDVKALRGKEHDKLIDYVVLAEFDIDTGSTVRHQYPNVIPGYKSDWFAEFMLPEGAHNRDVDYTYIFLNREDKQIDHDFWLKPNHGHSSDVTTSTEEKHFLYGINLVKTKHDSSVRRGAIVKAMCVFSRYQYIEAFKKPLDMALEKYFSHPSIDVLKKLYDSFNSIDLSLLPRPNLMEQCLMRRGVHFEQNAIFWCADHLPQSWVHSLPFVLQGNGFEEDTQNEPILLSIPLYHTPDEVGDISVTQLVRTFGESVMQIFHNILMKQRVLFVGYNHAAGDVAQMVLSAVAMVAPPLTNIIKRTYPYANLSDLTFLEVKGYVAGVTNPMFQQRDSWWDLLCVLDLPNGTGTIQSAEEKRVDEGSRGGSSHGGSSSTGGNNKLSAHSSRTNLASYEDSSHYSADNRFISGVLSGINARLGEEWVRQQFYDYMSCIANHTQDRSVLSHNQKVGDDKSRKFVEANSLRVAALHSNPEFRGVPHHPWAWCKEHASENGDHSTRASVHQRVESDVGVVASSPSGSDIMGTSPVAQSLMTGGGGGIAFREDTTSNENTTSTSEITEIGSSLPNESATLSTSPVATSPLTADLSAIANTAASLQRSPRRRASERHKDAGTLMKMYVRKLQFEAGQESVNETQRYFQHLQKNLQSECSLQALLVMLPESTGGLACIATGLFHSSPRVRYCATMILTKVQEFRSTRCAYHALNKMFTSAYDRQLLRVGSGALLKEIEDTPLEPTTPDVTPTKTPVERRTSIQPVAVEAPSAMTLLDSTVDDLSNLLQSTLDGLLNSPDSGADGDFHYAFSNTIDELDMIP